MMRKVVLLFIIIFLPHVITGQTYVHPAHWSRYIVVSPGYLGPNAIPVPPMYNALNNQKMELEFGLASHINKDDQTQNIFTRLYYPIAEAIVALDFYVVPLETFQMTDKIILERNLPESKKRGIAGGDIYFGTIIQLLKNLQKLPDVTISMNCKTASGTNLQNGRYSDTPGYWFDVTMGKSVFKSDNIMNNIRLSLMGGFYSWQTYRPNPQNDAFIYGIRTDIKLKKILFYNTLSGYNGRFDNQRDNPLIYRFFIEKEKIKSKYKFMFEHGFRDFNYTSFMVSLIYILDKPFEKPPFYL